MAIGMETATVYRVRGRRWLTLKAAIRSEAFAQLREEMGGCNCEPQGLDSSGYTCDYHSLATGVLDARIAQVKAEWEARNEQ